MENRSQSIKAYEHIKRVSKKNNINFYNSLNQCSQIELKVSKKKFYEFLIKLIISQQISTKAASKIWLRVESFLKKNKKIKDRDLKSCGLSKQKINYISGILDNKNLMHTKKSDLIKMKSKELSSYLLSIKGVGDWTVGMILIFFLGKEDVWLNNDHGVKKGVEKFNIHEDTIMEYSPFLSYLCLYLWKNL